MVVTASLARWHRSELRHPRAATSGHLGHCRVIPISGSPSKLKVVARGRWHVEDHRARDPIPRDTAGALRPYVRPVLLAGALIPAEPRVVAESFEVAVATAPLAAMRLAPLAGSGGTEVGDLHEPTIPLSPFRFRRRR